jgi:hypothetical protein
MLTERELLAKWKREHAEAGRIYGYLVRRAKNGLYQLDLDLNLNNNAPGQSHLTAPGRCRVGGRVLSITNPLSNKDKAHRFIIDTKSPLYQEILGEAREFTENYLNTNPSNSFDLDFFNKLADKINISLKSRKIIYKFLDFNERTKSRYPVWFNQENTEAFWVCFHHSTLQNAIIEDLIREYKLPFQVFSLFNYFIDPESQNPHRISLITDLEGRILYIMEQGFVARPAEPITITELFTPDPDGYRAIYRLGLDGRVDAGYYLLYNTFFTDDPKVTTTYQLHPDGEKIPVEVLRKKLEKAQAEYAQQQGQPNPSVESPATPSQNQPTP